jgi:thiamine-phosphate pyrophosphorylase
MSLLLNYITDRRAFAGDDRARRRQLLDKIAEAASEGVDYIQLREKDLPARELESSAREAMSIIFKLRTENREVRTALLINTRIDVALAAEADGVHLPAQDLTPEEVKAAWHEARVGRVGREISARPVIGVSCHSQEEVGQAAANGASFAVFGPVFEKIDAPEKSPAGLESLRRACRADIPVLALGGVTLQNARACGEAGAAGIAAIRLFQENDIARIARELRG